MEKGKSAEEKQRSLSKMREKSEKRVELDKYYNTLCNY